MPFFGVNIYSVLALFLLHKFSLFLRNLNSFEPILPALCERMDDCLLVISNRTHRARKVINNTDKRN